MSAASLRVGSLEKKKTGGKAGIYTGLLNALVLATILAVLGIELLQAISLFFASRIDVLYHLILFPVLGFIGYLGGVLGGALKER